MSEPAALQCPRCGDPVPAPDLLDGAPTCPRCFLRFVLPEGPGGLDGAIDRLASDAGDVWPGALADAAPMPPEVLAAPRAFWLGKFVQVERVAAGRMAEVWRAWDLALGRWVALKFPLPGERHVAQFLQEVRVVGRLSHPHIPAVHEVGTAGGRHFMAMQFVAGPTLRALPRGGDLRRLITVLRDAAGAVHYAHTQGVVHRDLKPENLMVVGADSAAPHVYVLDFGLSVAADQPAGGSPSYMAIEQAKGAADARSDVWGLGATLYDRLVGRPPFTGESVYQILARVLTERPRPPRAIDPAIPAALDAIVMRCLERNPRDRFPTAQALAEALSDWLGRTVEATRPADGAPA